MINKWIRNQAQILTHWQFVKDYPLLQGCTITPQGELSQAHWTGFQVDDGLQIWIVEQEQSQISGFQTALGGQGKTLWHFLLQRHVFGFS